MKGSGGRTGSNGRDWQERLQPQLRQAADQSYEAARTAPRGLAPMSALALMAGLAPAYAENSAEAVLACMRANVPASVQLQKLELASTNNIGDTRTLQGRLFATREQGLLRAMLRLDAPRNLAGAAYLVRETEDYLRDGMFVYLPAVQRVRRVTGTFADGALMGTDFSYYDFRQLQSAFGDMQAVLEAPLEIDGRAPGRLVLVSEELRRVQVEVVPLRSEGVVDDVEAVRSHRLLEQTPERLLAVTVQGSRRIHDTRSGAVREGEVDEDDLAAEDMDAEVAVDAGQDQAHGQRGQHPAHPRRNSG